MAVVVPYKSNRPLKGFNAPKSKLAYKKPTKLGCYPKGHPLGGFGFIVGGTANQSTTSVSDAETGAAIGAVFGPIGAAIGAAVGAIGSLFGPAKLGQAAVTWNNMTSEGYLLQNTNPISYDERYIGEAYKGAMDEGNNIWPGCGSDGYKNPDCFYAPLAQAIISGYLNKVVPITAEPAQVWSAVVVPWLQSGAGGLFNWPAAVAEANAQKLPYSQQELLIEAAMTRYLNGLPITRANMPAYAASGGASTYAQWNTPSITTALASLLVPPPAPTPAPAAAAPAPTPVAAPVPVTGLPAPTQSLAQAVATPAPAPVPAPAVIATTSAGTPVVAPDDTDALIAQLIAQGQSQTQALTSAMAILEANNINSQTPQVQQQLQQAVAAAAPSSGISTTDMLLIGGAALALILLMKK
jgi:hypothetical protein